MPSLATRLTRKKHVTFDKETLPRVLSLIDLTFLGIGSTVGVGFYILAGQVARNIAGPAVTISFLIAGIASVFAGLCYAEFGSRVPKAGSAYIYSYVCVGEFTAFVIGWNLVLEYVIGTASVARGFSAYIDELANNSISNALDNAMHMGSGSAPNYPDFLSFSIVILLAVVLSIGVKESSSVNNVFTTINLFVIVYAIIACSTKADPNNWKLSEDHVNMYSNETVCLQPKFEKLEENPWGHGGFSPYGFDGIIQGAATCFFGFVGFDVIATTGEEAMNPGRNIPLSIILSLAFIFASYFGLSVVLTMAIPYCMQDAQAPLIQLFDYYHMIPSKWIVSIGAIFGFSASLFGVMFPMPRILYAMADDGLIFRFMSRISKKFKTPVAATIVASSLAALMALLFSLDSLVNMMSIGTLMAYTIVAICVMLLRFTDLHVDNNAAEYVLLRYSPDVPSEKLFKDNSLKLAERKEKSSNDKYSIHDYIGQIFNLNDPNNKPLCVGGALTYSFFVLSLILAILVSVFGASLVNGDGLALSLVSIFAILSILNLFLLSRQPQSNASLVFKVPLVPWLPGLSTFINLYLMCNLPIETWIRFAIWMTIGLVLYFSYGMKHSVEEKSSSGIVPTPMDANPDIVNCHESRKSLHIPHILIQPPTPRSSLKGSRFFQKRVSIAESPPIIINDYPSKFETEPLEKLTKSPKYVSDTRRTRQLTDKGDYIHNSIDEDRIIRVKACKSSTILKNVAAVPSHYKAVDKHSNASAIYLPETPPTVPNTQSDKQIKKESELVIPTAVVDVDMPLDCPAPGNSSIVPSLSSSILALNLFDNYSLDRKFSVQSGHNTTSEPSTPNLPRRKVLKRGRSFDVLTTTGDESDTPHRYIITPIYYDDKSSTDGSRRPSEISMANELHRKLFPLV